MTDNLYSSEIEKEIEKLLVSPKPAGEFVSRLANQLHLQAVRQEKRAVRSLLFRPAFIASAVAAVLLIASILYYSPEAVYAAVCKLFGYMPGVGLIDENAPVRILKQPVSITRDGVTISVNSVILTADETQIDFDISGVPASAYADEEHASSCPLLEEFMQLPDGTRQDAFAPIPAEIDHATFLLPCIFYTLPDTLPTNWEIPLEFIPLPPQATIFPVVEQPSETAVNPQSTDGQSADESFTLAVDQFIAADSGYILMGSFHAASPEDGWMQITDAIQVEDANGQAVEYSVPEDIQVVDDAIKQSPWVLQIDNTQVVFPVTIRIPGNVYTLVDPSLTASLEFDAGDDPQFGQEWTMNQDIVLGKYHILLETIRASENGYTFKFKYHDDANGNITMPRVGIEGFQPVGGGGGGGSGGGEANLNFKSIPTGKLKLIFSDIYVVTDNISWEVQWQPE